MNAQHLIRSNVGRLLGTLLLLTAIVGFTGWWYIRSLGKELGALSTENLDGSIHLSNAEHALWEMRFALPNYVLQDVATRPEIAASTDRHVQQIKEHMKAYGELPLSPEERQLLDEWQGSFSAYLRARPGYFALVDAGKLDEAKEHRGRETNPAAAHAVAVLESLIETQRRVGHERDVRAQKSADQATWIMLALIFVAIGLGAALGRALTQRVAESMRTLQRSTSDLGTNAEGLLGGARELSVATAQISGTLQELLVTSRQISESAREVAAAARETGTSAQSGDDLAKRAQESLGLMRVKVDAIVQRMEELGRSSQEIGGVTEIIRELAEQTNILSINASIEAAGAGAAGLRFGVVADEIRRLADRVSSSSREIRELTERVRAATHTTVMATEDGAKTVEASSRHFGEVLKTFQQISGRVDATTVAAHQIELSTKQQTTAVEQVSVAMNELVRTAKSTEGSSQEMTHTCEQLGQLSRRLSELAGTSEALRPAEH
jgi:methyl-accepting chemotaxis protein